MHGRSYHGPSPGPSSSAWRSRWRCRAHAWFACAAIAWPCLASFPLSAQSSPLPSPIGAEDYATFRADCETVRLQLESYETVLKLALGVNESISGELRKAQLELQSYKESSTQSYSDLLERVAMLERQLSESNASVSALRSSLDSKAQEYQEKLQLASAQAKRLERSRNGWRAAAVAAIAAAVGAGIWAAVAR